MRETPPADASGAHSKEWQHAQLGLTWGGPLPAGPHARPERARPALEVAARARRAARAAIAHADRDAA